MNHLQIIQTVASLEDQFGGDSVSLLAYDSVLAVAKALDDASAAVNISDFNASELGKDGVKKAVRESIRNVTFYGATVSPLNECASWDQIEYCDHTAGSIEV